MFCIVIATFNIVVILELSDVHGRIKRIHNQIEKRRKENDETLTEQALDQYLQEVGFLTLKQSLYIMFLGTRHQIPFRPLKISSIESRLFLIYLHIYWASIVVDHNVSVSSCSSSNRSYY